MRRANIRLVVGAVLVVVVAACGGDSGESSVTTTVIDTTATTDSAGAPSTTVPPVPDSTTTTLPLASITVDDAIETIRAALGDEWAEALVVTPDPFSGFFNSCGVQATQRVSADALRLQMSAFRNNFAVTVDPRQPADILQQVAASNDLCGQEEEEQADHTAFRDSSATLETVNGVEGLTVRSRTVTVWDSETLSDSVLDIQTALFFENGLAVEVYVYVWVPQAEDASEVDASPLLDELAFTVVDAIKDLDS